MGIMLENYPGAGYVRIGGLNYPYAFFRHIGLRLAEGDKLRLTIYRNNDMVYIAEEQISVFVEKENPASEAQGEATITPPVLDTRKRKSRPR